MQLKTTKITIEIPFEVELIENSDKSTRIRIMPTQEFSDQFGISFVAEGATLDEASKKFKTMLLVCVAFLKEQTVKKVWVAGPKSEYSKSRWFEFLNFHLSIRIGPNMKGGWYIPFTQINLSFKNLWVW